MHYWYQQLLGSEKLTGKLKKSPIAEALCELRFTSEGQWDFTIPGLIYEQVKNKFPIKEQQIGIEMQFRPTEKGFEHKIEQASPRTQFFRRDRKALLQVAPDLFVINHLKPYPSWGKFKHLILNNFQLYRTVAEPKGFKRIALRYINKINIDNNSINLEDYFTFYPSTPSELPQDIVGFISRVEISYCDDRDRLLITLASTKPEKPNIVSIILDMDYIMNKPETVSMNSFDEWIEEAHATIKTTFESCITDKCKAMLEGVK